MAAGSVGPLPSSGSSSELDRVRAIVSSYFPVYETRIGPQSVLLAVHTDPATLEAKFDGLRRELWRLEYVPLLRRQSGEEFIEIVRRPTLGPPRLWINVLLLVGTILTTTFAGSLIWLTYVGSNTLGWSDLGWGALYFGLPVMTILALHELAHYVVARRHHVEASLPYFIPIPPPFLFGTFGAFISIREPFPDKKALFDIGAAGPIAGFAASIPIALAGLYLSLHAPVLPLSYCGPTVLGVSYAHLLVGPSLFWYGLSLFFPPSLISLSPLALAGWVGVLVTAINLLPAGQLDGGHVLRALAGDRSRYVSYGIVVILLGIGLYFYYGWIIFAILILFLGARHPPPLNDQTPLDAKRYAVGAFVAAVLVTGFVLTPLASPPGSIGVGTANSEVLAPPPGAAIAANLSITVANEDPIVHGFLFSTSIAQVTVENGTLEMNLTGAALASWSANATWTFYLPNGGTVTQHGPVFDLPTSDFVTLNATGTPQSQATIVITFSNTQPAAGTVIDWSTSEFCGATTTFGGAKSAQFTTTWT
ncbi:MAG TPA: site-2 protease family protein [Thermoplasmata archaeon]|nr:site-2 protease family protein [Thermoplasmata archaeon]